MRTLQWHKWNKRWLRAWLAYFEWRISFSFWLAVALVLGWLYRYREATRRLFSLGMLVYLASTTVAFLVLSWLNLH